MIAVAAETLAHLGRPDVARELDHLGEGQPAVGVRVVDRPAARLEPPVLAEEELSRGHEMLLDRRRREHRLEGGAGLVRVRDRPVAHPVAPALIGRVAGLVRVVGGDVREGEDLAGGRVEHDGRTTHCARRGDAALELALGRLLDGGIERQLEAVSLVRGSADAAGEHLAAARIAIELQVLRLAADDPVIALLEPFEPLGVDADEAEHVGRQVAVRVEPPAFGDRVDPRELEPRDRLRLARQGLALEPDERLAARELRPQRAWRHVQRGGERGEASVDPGRAQFPRPNVDRRDVDRQGQRVPGAVDNGSSVRKQLDALMVLHGCQPGKGGSAEHGQIERPQRDEREEDREDASRDDHAPRPGALHGSVTTCPFSASRMPSRWRAMSAMRAGSRSVAISTSSSWRSCSSRSCIWRADDSS